MRRSVLGLIAVTTALVLSLVAGVLGIVAMTRNHPQTITLSAPVADQRRTVAVSGTGIANLSSDIARFNVGVQEQGKSLTDVQGTVARKVDAIVTAMKNGGVDVTKDVKTAGISIQPQYDYPKDRSPLLTGYRVVNTVNVTVRDINKAGILFDAAVQAGANSAGNISFGLADPEKANNVARDEAMKNAKSKADAIAKASGVTVGPVLTVSDQTASPGPPRDALANAAPSVAGGAPPTTPIQSGETSVTITVNVTYQLQ